MMVGPGVACTDRPAKTLPIPGVEEAGSAQENHLRRDWSDRGAHRRGMDVPTTLAGWRCSVLTPPSVHRSFVLTQPTVRGCCHSQPWEGR